MTRKKLLIIIICILIAVGIAFGGIVLFRQAAKPKLTNIKIGVSVYNINDTFIAGILSELEVSAKEYEQQTGYKVTIDISDAQNSQRIQNSQIKKYISLGYDVLCVNLVDRTNTSSIIEDAIAANTPIVFFNREPVQEDILRADNIYYVGSDAKQSAILQGQIVYNAWNLNPNNIDLNGDGTIAYAMLEGEAGHQDATIRTKWSVSTLTDYGLSVQKVTGSVANWSRSQAAAFVEQWYADPLLVGEDYKGIELIICNNDNMALGAADALKKLNISQKVAIVGIDAVSNALNEIKLGNLLGTVDCNQKGHAKAILQIATSLAMDVPIPDTVKLENERYVRVPLHIITAENL